MLYWGFLLKFGPKILVWWEKKGQKISGAVREDLATYMYDLSLNSHL
jgi:hypothetical protein